MAASKKKVDKDTGWGEVAGFTLWELPPENKQAYDIGVFCMECGGAVMTHIMRYDGSLSLQLPVRCPICNGEGDHAEK